MQEFLVRTREKKFLTQKVMELWVDLLLPDTIHFQAGQYMQFMVGDQFRAYSILDVPDHNKSLRFCIELLETGAGSDFIRSLRVGDDFRMRGPLGTFTVPLFLRNFFFVATGVGVAPYASIIPDMLSRGYSKEARLLFGIRSEEDVFYFNKFNHLASIYQNFKFIPILSNPQSHWPGEVGRVTTHLDAVYDYYADSIFYLCGGKEMVGEARDLLLRRGHKLTDIRMEIFV